MSSHLGHRYHTSALIHHKFDVIRHITISILLTSTVKLSRVNLRCQNKLSKDEAIQPGLMPGVYSNSLSRTSRCCAFSHCVATPPSPPPQARPVAPAKRMKSASARLSGSPRQAPPLCAIDSRCGHHASQISQPSAAGRKSHLTAKALLPAESAWPLTKWNLSLHPLRTDERAQNPLKERWLSRRTVLDLVH